MTVNQSGKSIITIGGTMKDYRRRIGMRFVQQGREFVIEGPLLDNQLKIKDTFTDVCFARTTAYTHREHG
jgi:hypothetical protein